MSETDQQIPKIIWTMWAQGEVQAPEIVRRCWASWRKYNPEYTFIKVSDENVHKFVDTDRPPTVSLQTWSDLARITLLAKFGGVWADATCFCCAPLDGWLGRYVGSGFFAFRDPGPDRILSNWFLASSTNSYIAQRLQVRFAEYLSKGGMREWSTTWAGRVARRVHTRYLATSPQLPLIWLKYPIRRWLRVYPYYCFHYLFADLVKRDRTFREAWNSMKFLPADGPHGLLSHGLWKRATLQLRNEIDRVDVPLYKLSWKEARPASIGCPCALDYLMSAHKIDQDLFDPSTVVRRRSNNGRLMASAQLGAGGPRI